MINARAAIEQMRSGQIGQPAACMIENKDNPRQKNGIRSLKAMQARAGFARDYGLKPPRD